MNISSIKSKFSHKVNETIRIPNVSYKYSENIRSSIVNNKEVLNDDNDNDTVTCKCNEYESKYFNNHS